MASNQINFFLVDFTGFVIRGATSDASNDEHQIKLLYGAFGGGWLRVFAKIDYINAIKTPLMEYTNMANMNDELFIKGLQLTMQSDDITAKFRLDMPI